MALPPVVRVVLAEDGVLLREGLRDLLTRFRFEVVDAVGDATALARAVSEHRPGLVVTDIRMPPDFTDDGLRTVVRARRRHPELPVVALSQYVRQEYAAQLLGSGDGSRVGYLLKDRIVDVAEFAGVLRRVVDGGTVIDPDVVRELMRQRGDPLDRLSPRELEVLGLIAEGRSNASVAEAIVVTEGAVSKHVRSIFAKLDLPPTADVNRRVLAVLAYLDRGRPA
ncbi:response regulator [Streptomyces sp. NPDC001443]